MGHTVDLDIHARAQHILQSRPLLDLCTREHVRRNGSRLHGLKEKEAKMVELQGFREFGPTSSTSLELLCIADTLPWKQVLEERFPNIALIGLGLVRSAIAFVLCSSSFRAPGFLILI